MTRPMGVSLRQLHIVSTFRSNVFPANHSECAVLSQLSLQKMPGRNECASAAIMSHSVGHLRALTAQAVAGCIATVLACKA